MEVPMDVTSGIQIENKLQFITRIWFKCKIMEI